MGTIHFKGMDHQIGHGTEGPLTEWLRHTLTGIHAGNSERHREWIHIVPQN